MTNIIPVEVNEDAVAVKQQNALFAAMEELFAGSGASKVTLPSSQLEVQVNAAKVKHLKQITGFVQDFLSNFNSNEIGQIIAMTSLAQKQRVEEGEDPFSNIAGKIETFVGGAELIARITQAGLTQLPRWVTLFCNITEEQFEDLEMDEGAMVAYAVFGRNYHFFSQRVLPIIRGSIALLYLKPKAAKTE